MKWRWGIIFILLVSNFALWSVVIAETPTGKLKITFLDVGQGDSILIEAPNHNQMLIDGGPGKQVLAALGRNLPWFDHSLDLLLATHPDSDHIAGLIDVLDNYSAEGLLEPQAADKNLYQTLVATAERQKVQEIKAEPGMVINLDRGVKLEILAARKGLNSNESSIVAKLTYGGTSALMGGDAPKSLEDQLAYEEPAKIRVNLLKLSHHGSKTSSSAKFLMTTRPDYAIISVAKDNRYGLPSPEVLTLLQKLKIKTLRTDEKGDISFESDGFSFQPIGSL